MIQPLIKVKQNKMSDSKHSITSLLEKVISSPKTITFDDTMATIDTNYTFTPTKFSNGKTVNEAGSNNGSCKIFAFSKLHNLTPEQTLALFGDYYRIDVLQNPEANDHANIRNFIQSGWNGIIFEAVALQTNKPVNDQ